MPGIPSRNFTKYLIKVQADIDGDEVSLPSIITFARASAKFRLLDNLQTI